jgi:hypothetical protein
MAMLGGVSAGLAASRRDHSYGRITGPYGTYTIHTSYPSLAGQLEANNISLNTAWGIAAIQYQLDRTIEIIDDHVVQRTTVDPGATYGGLIILDKLKRGNPPFELHLDVDWNGERYPFAYVMQSPGRPVPERYAAMLAEHAKPSARVAVFSESPAQNGVAAARMPASAMKVVKGAILLSSGAVKIPAKTSSGYCLKVPRDYVATGDENYPVITGALPRCLDDSGRVAARNDSPFRRN